MVLVLSATTFHAIVRQLRLDEVHLGTELRRLPQLRITLCRRRASQRLAVLALNQSRLARVLANRHVDLLCILVIIEGRHILFRVLVPVCLPHLHYRVPLRAESRVVRVRVLCVRRIERGELVGMDLGSSDAALEIPLLQIARVELDVVGQNAGVALIHLVNEDLFHAVGVVVLRVPLRNEALTHLLECVLRVLFATLHLDSRNDALLTVAADGNSMLPLRLFLLAVVDRLIQAVLLLLVLHLQMVLVVRVDLRVRARANRHVHATSFDRARPASDLQFALHLPFIAIVA